MALITISIHDRPDSGTIVVHCSAHGVRQGSYGDLWSVRKELTPEGPSAVAALRALARWIGEIQGPM